MAGNPIKTVLRLDPEIVRDVLDYDPETGALTFRKRLGRRAVLGAIAGSVHKYSGYRLIGINKQQYFAHHMAWAHYYGIWPTCELDHINGDKLDNRICNLRQCDRFQQSQNRGIQANNRTGRKGVCPTPGSKTYKARIAARGKEISLGHFPTIEDAAAAYERAARKLHGTFARID